VSSNLPTINGSATAARSGRPLLRHHGRALDAALATFRARPDRLELWHLLGAALDLRVALRDHEVICLAHAADADLTHAHERLRQALDDLIRVANRTVDVANDRELVVAAAARVSELVAAHDAPRSEPLESPAAAAF